MIDDILKDFIVTEIHKQLEPMSDAVAEVKRQNTFQTLILDRQATKLGDIDAWRRALWGNGSGPPGYLEVARAEDKQKYDKLLSAVSELKAGTLRQEGKDQLLKEQEHQKTSRLTRAHLWIAIFGCFCGAWTLTLVRPILRIMLEHLAKLIQ